MKAKLFDQDGSEKGIVDLPEDVFGGEINETCLHLVITLYQANQRQGTAKTKTRAEVSGGGKKPWRQKGTGRARAGSNTSPLWVRGGKAFGPVPRDYSTTIPRKMRKVALRSALISRAAAERIYVVDHIACDTPKTKTVVRLLDALSCRGKRTLLVLPEVSRALYLSGRNIPDLDIKVLRDVNAWDVMRNDTIVFADRAVLEKVSEAVAS